MGLNPKVIGNHNVPIKTRVIGSVRLGTRRRESESVWELKTSAIRQEIRGERTISSIKTRCHTIYWTKKQAALILWGTPRRTLHKQGNPIRRVESGPYLRRFSANLIMFGFYRPEIKDPLRSSITFSLLKLKAPLYYQSSLPSPICVPSVWSSSICFAKNLTDVCLRFLHTPKFKPYARAIRSRLPNHFSIYTDSVVTYLERDQRQLLISICFKTTRVNQTWTGFVSLSCFNGELTAVPEIVT